MVILEDVIVVIICSGVKEGVSSRLEASHVLDILGGAIHKLVDAGNSD